MKFDKRLDKLEEATHDEPAFATLDEWYAFQNTAEGKAEQENYYNPDRNDESEQ